MPQDVREVAMFNPRKKSSVNQPSLYEKGISTLKAFLQHLHWLKEHENVYISSLL